VDDSISLFSALRIDLNKSWFICTPAGKIYSSDSDEVA